MSAPEAHAGAFHVSPVRLGLSDSSSTIAVTVRNTGTEESVMQLQLVSWSQVDGEDSYAPTQDVLATPPIFSVAPGATQIVRVGLRRRPEELRELAYRLFIQEVPVTAQRAGQVRVTVRFSIPVFVAPLSAPAAPVLDWRVKAVSAKELRIAAVNRGNAHVQIFGLALQPAGGGATLADQKESVYLLAGQRREWLIPLQRTQPGMTRVKILAGSDAGDLEAEAALEN